MSIPENIISNFLGGLAWGLGSVLGATIIVSLLVIILKKVNLIPVIGKFANKLLQEIDSKNLPK